MPSIAAIIFPFRRLAIWLSVLVLAVAALALCITALLVVPSLRDNLVNARVAEIDRSAKANLKLFLSSEINYADAVGLRAADRQPGRRARHAERSRRLPAGGGQRARRDHRPARPGGAE